MCDYTWKWYLNHYDQSSNCVIAGLGFELGPPGWKSEVLTARPRQLLVCVIIHGNGI